MTKGGTTFNMLYESFCSVEGICDDSYQLRSVIIGDKSVIFNKDDVTPVRSSEHLPSSGNQRRETMYFLVDISSELSGTQDFNFGTFYEADSFEKVHSCENCNYCNFTWDKL
ncbi:hypothetical protein AB6A40_005642 [Gnathostoma spinigerum]|uniref:Uncharacterized protein n=1 Tax=Gnathostoma spinigerum TaxID=75299 RepID=A0ABD6EG66_9BILA